ncbi:hypothetical protein [Synechococcus sp. LA31]|uniref:hypothetical protein n=1 Tax=Synechococcus sp. LA31 TaxID=2741953 RepID=UPI001BDC30F0|nr:hypothetical protein [Synechococcus sp. LA31]QVV67056.1 hypothetical protein KJJ24_11395 [Synechococcus sp. LA31]
MRELESKKRSQRLETEIERRTLALLLNANSSLQKHQEADSSSNNQWQRFSSKSKYPSAIDYLIHQ